jgi:3-methylcrotonyl-CoA carboxylase alpha subunit
VSNGTFVFRNGRSTETFHCVRDGSTIHLFWRGTVYRLVEEAEARRGADRHGGSLEAPMPGKVIKVSVEPGCTVKKGDEIFVVEAMKMENAVRAPCDGTVKSVAIRVGDMVDTGVALVEIA